MKESVLNQLNEDLNLIKKVLKISTNNENESQKLFHGILQEIIKIRHIEPGSKKHMYWEDVYESIQQILNIDSENYEWHEAVAGVAIVLEGTSPLCSNTLEASQNAEEAYKYLLGIIPQE